MRYIPVFIEQTRGRAPGHDVERFIRSEVVIQGFLDMQETLGLEHVVFDDDLRRLARELGVSLRSMKSLLRKERAWR